MKKILLVILASVAFSVASQAQTIIDANDQTNPNQFYEKTSKQTPREPIKQPSVRENDVIWETVVWREISLEEKFNQFMYFPTDASKDAQGRISLVALLYDAAKEQKFEIYDNDDMTEPLTWEDAMKKVASQEVKKVPSGELDEDDEIIYKDSIAFVDDFDASTAKKLRIKEYWYIDKQDSRQKFRIVGLAFLFEKTTYQAGNQVINQETSFWVPMNDYNVRKVLANSYAYDENNDVNEISYDFIFNSRMFDSYIIRESNVYNRSLADYLTGEDAILESQIIEEKIFNIESDMWEY
jgi:gliding motility associated protien GldN